MKKGVRNPKNMNGGGANKLRGCEMDNITGDLRVGHMENGAIQEYEWLKTPTYRALVEAQTIECAEFNHHFVLMARAPVYNYGEREAWLLQDPIRVQWLLDKRFIMAKEPELKPCPFCGSTDIIGDYRKQCSNCYSTSTHEDSKENAITAWNRRA